jgi:hypothetical protein
VIRNAEAGREMTLMRWGMPPPPRTIGPPVTNIRNTSSSHWRMTADRRIRFWLSIARDHLNTEIYRNTMAIDHTVAGDRHREGDFMVFYDNFVEVQPGFLIDPLLKLCVQFGSTSGLDPDQAFLNIKYDPEIDPNRLLVPPSEEDRRIWLMSPLTAHRADQPKIFRSDRYDEVQSIGLVWSVEGDCIRYKIRDDVSSFRFIEKVIEVKQFSVMSDNAHDTLLYALSSATRLTAIRTHDFRDPKFAGIKTAEVWIHADVLVDYFNLPLTEYRSPEPGWVILSSREIVRRPSSMLASSMTRSTPLSPVIRLNLCSCATPAAIGAPMSGRCLSRPARAERPKFLLNL